MKQKSHREHSMASLFSMLLFALYALFILLLLLFFAKAYQTAVTGQKENDNLHTARIYITTKFHQHDEQGMIFPDTLHGIDALCFLDKIDGCEYQTYLYLQDGRLKELFAAVGVLPSPDMGTPIAELSSFQVEEDQNGFYHITLVDTQGTRTEFLLHPGGPDMSGERSSHA